MHNSVVVFAKTHHLLAIFGHKSTIKGANTKKKNVNKL